MIGVLVFVGIVLTTVGVLYFFDIKFCEDKTQAITALTGGLLVFAGSAMALASSSTSLFFIGLNKCRHRRVNSRRKQLIPGIATAILTKQFTITLSAA